MDINLVYVVAGLIFAFLIFRNIVRVVPQNEAFIVERLGKYSSTLEAGIHFLMPFLDKVAYRHSLKEFAVDVPAQQAITKDNVALGVDGVCVLWTRAPRRMVLRICVSRLCSWRKPPCEPRLVN